MLERTEIKDRDQKCVKCGSALTELERMEIGERCVFCGELVFEIPVKCKTGIVEHLMGTYLNRKVYCLKLRLRLKYGKAAFTYYLGSLGTLGLSEFVGLESVDLKRKLIKSLRGWVRYKKEE